MTLRGRFVAYLVAVHAAFAALAIVLLIRQPYWLFAVELAFVVSLATGVRIGQRMFAHLGIAAEGTRLLEERQLTSRFRPVGQPEVDELIAVYNRMVDNLRAERTRLQEQHNFLLQLVRVSPSGIVILDFDRRISNVNPAAERLLGAAATALIGHQLDELSSPLARALAALAPGTTELVRLGDASRVRCHHGTFLDRGFTRSFRIVEELTQEVRQFERSAYEKLIRVMSHEVGNSVTASNSLLQSCLAYAPQLDAASRADFEQAIGVAIGRTEKLNAFMHRFAEVFRLPPPIRRQVAVAPMLEEIVRLVSARPEARRIAWVWDVADRSLDASLDRAQMEQVFLNVLKNAIEAAGPGGTVTIRLHADRDRAVVVVEDSGPDLPPEALENLFTPFFSTKPDGQGIGLTLVREILAAHGFEHGLDRPPGGPTRFTVKL